MGARYVVKSYRKRIASNRPATHQGWGVYDTETGTWLDVYKSQRVARAGAAVKNEETKTG